MRWGRTWAGVVAISALLSVCPFVVAETAFAHHNGGVVACEEDQRCWNWRTMGNHKRGVVTIGGRRIVVGPKRFDRLFAQEGIDWRRTPILRGDNG